MRLNENERSQEWTKELTIHWPCQVIRNAVAKIEELFEEKSMFRRPYEFDRLSSLSYRSPGLLHLISIAEFLQWIISPPHWHRNSYVNLLSAQASLSAVWYGKSVSTSHWQGNRGQTCSIRVSNQSTPKGVVERWLLLSNEDDDNGATSNNATVEERLTWYSR